MNIDEAIRTALEEEEARTQHRMPPLQDLLDRGAVRGRRRRATHLAAAGVAAALALGAVAVAINQTTQPAPPASSSSRSTSTAPAAPATTLPATVSVRGDGSTGPDYAGSYQERQIMRTLKHEAAWEAEGIKVGRIGVRAGGTTPTMAAEVYGDVDRFIQIALQDRDPRVRIIIEPLAQSPTPASGFPLPDSSVSDASKSST